MNFLRRQWFLSGLAGVCVLGYFYPAAGEIFSPLVPWLVALIMFLMGTGQDLLDLWRSLQKLHAILLTLINNFLVMPAFTYLLGLLLFASHPVLFSGMMILGAAPTTTASSIVWTRLANGNTSLSLVLTVFSTMASVFFIPLILEISLGRTTELPALEMFLKLFLVIGLPVLIGQVVRRILPAVRHMDRITPGTGHAVILVIVLTAVARSAEHLFLGLILYISVGVVLVNLVVSAHSYYASRWMGLNLPDSIAVLFGSSQKALTIGLMVGLMYFEPLATLPMLIYHVFQQFSAYGLSQLLAGHGRLETYLK